MINNSDSPYIRGIGFMYIRFCQPPQDLWAWMEPYLDDEEQIDPRSGGGDVMVMAQVVKMMLTKLDWYGTLFPRIPVPIQKEIELKFREKAKLDYQREHGDREGDYERHRSRSRSRDRLRERSKDRDRDRDRERSRERDRERDRDRTRGRSRERRRDSRGRSREKSTARSSYASDKKRKHGGNRYKCKHHLRHHHCRKHKEYCPAKAKKACQEKLEKNTKS